MACFLVPATEAAVTTIAEHVVKGKEERANKEELTLSENSKTPFSHKLKWLNHMLWGGSALLAFEHIMVPIFNSSRKSGGCDSNAP